MLEAAASLNYQPNALAQNFATGKSGNIGVIIPYLPKVHLLSTYYFLEILSGIGVELGRRNVHKEITIAAAKAGKHLYCEKPLVLTLADAREMLAAAEASGVKHMVGFNYRFTPAVMLAKKLIDEGRLGDIYHFRGWFLQDWITDPNFPLVWRLQEDIAGSGSHGDLGAHLIDMRPLKNLISSYIPIDWSGNRRLLREQQCKD